MLGPIYKLARICTDFEQLGLGTSESPSADTLTYSALYALAMKTKRIGHTYINKNSLSKPSTELGTRLGKLIVDGVKFNEPGRRNDANVCCELSEVYLRDSLKMETNGIPPIIVTDAKVPIAFIKLGDLVAYGIADRPKIGILSGVFSSVKKNN